MSDIDLIKEKIKNLNADDYVKEKLLKELARFKNYGNNGVEGNVIKTYLDTMLEMPWNNMTEENPDLENAQKILDRDHYGLDKVKERMIEFYLENQNFWDMRRWLLAEKYFSQKVQGLNNKATTIEELATLTTYDFERKFGSHQYLLPIPLSDVNKNPQVVQNPGY